MQIDRGDGFAPISVPSSNVRSGAKTFRLVRDGRMGVRDSLIDATVWMHLSWREAAIAADPAACTGSSNVAEDPISVKLGDDEKS